MNENFVNQINNVEQPKLKNPRNPAPEPLLEVQQEKSKSPAFPGEWTEREMVKAFREQVPQSMQKRLTANKGGGVYYPWYNCVRILNKFAPGWRWEIRDMSTAGNRLFLVGRLTLVMAEGEVYREATGTELLLQERFDTDSKEHYLADLAYGDPSSNAESMAFRRACAKFYLGLEFYLQD